MPASLVSAFSPRLILRIARNAFRRPGALGVSPTTRAHHGSGLGRLGVASGTGHRMAWSLYVGARRYAHIAATPAPSSQTNSERAQPGAQHQLGNESHPHGGGRSNQDQDQSNANTDSKTGERGEQGQYDHGNQKAWGRFKQFFSTNPFLANALLSMVISATGDYGAQLYTMHITNKKLDEGSITMDDVRDPTNYQYQTAWDPFRSFRFGCWGFMTGGPIAIWFRFLDGRPLVVYRRFMARHFPNSFVKSKGDIESALASAPNPPVPLQGVHRFGQVLTKALMHQLLVVPIMNSCFFGWMTLCGLAQRDLLAVAQIMEEERHHKQGIDGLHTHDVADYSFSSHSALLHYVANTYHSGSLETSSAIAASPDSPLLIVSEVDNLDDNDAAISAAKSELTSAHPSQPVPVLTTPTVPAASTSTITTTSIDTSTVTKVTSWMRYLTSWVPTSWVPASITLPISKLWPARGDDYEARAIADAVGTVPVPTPEKLAQLRSEALGDTQVQKLASLVSVSNKPSDHLAAMAATPIAMAKRIPRVTLREFWDQWREHIIHDATAVSIRSFFILGPPQIINQSFVPVQYRAIFQSCMIIFWSSYLSIVSHSSTRKKQIESSP